MDNPFGPGPLSDCYAVLMLFLIPIGGGIPGGVLLAQSRGLPWPAMLVLYLISDIILACVFEPVLRFFIFVGGKAQFMKRFNERAKKAVHLSIAHYGNRSGPLALIIIAFGVDPMSGRAAAVAAGHGFVTGWLIAITGDMFYFAVLMICTLWLKSLVGDGRVVMLVILLLMILAPILVRRLRREMT
ncbi:MAG: hypothetical protein ABL958_16340 [Bdellovibrionia bacterium]